MKMITMTEFRKAPGEILRDVDRNNESFIITKNGKPVAKLTSIEHDDILVPSTEDVAPMNNSSEMELELTFVVNGEEVRLKLPPSEPLHVAVSKVLTKSKNAVDRKWELRYQNGLLIDDHSRPIDTYKFASGSYLYLTLAVGAGGHAMPDFLTGIARLRQNSSY